MLNKPVVWEGGDAIILKPVRNRKMSGTPLMFSERKKLGRLYSEWARKNNVADKPESVIAYLQIGGIINTDAARRLMESENTRHH